MGLQVSARNFGGFVAIFFAGLLAAIAPHYAFLLYGLAVFFLPLMWQVITDPPRLSATQQAAQASAMPRRWRAACNFGGNDLVADADQSHLFL